MNNSAIQPYYRMTELLLFTFSKFPQIVDYVILLPDSGSIKQLLAETKAAMLRVFKITSSPLKSHNRPELNSLIKTRSALIA